MAIWRIPPWIQPPVRHVITGGWDNIAKVNGVASADIAKTSGVAKVDISKVNSTAV